MSQPNLESVRAPSILAKKPQMNVYMVMLIIALLSLLFACLFLYLEIREYGGWGAEKGKVSAMVQPWDQASSMWA